MTADPSGDSRVWKMPTAVPTPTELCDAWSKVVANALTLFQSSAAGAANPSAPLAYDPTAAARAMGEFATHLWSNPAKLIEAQAEAAGDWMRLWAATGARLAGLDAEPVAVPERGDRRFKDPAWDADPVFDYLKQAYLLTARRAQALVAEAEGLDPATKTRAMFFTQQYLNALSPSNFAFTNPEAIRRAIDTGSISLLSGLANMLADAATDARLPQRRVGKDFELGVDIAATPGSVILENDLMQLIQYAPTTDTVLKRPLLYVPPLVNKYYLLDLQPKSSLIRWLVEQGHTVFVVSWVNPGPELADRNLSDYITQGPVAALDAIEAATGETSADLFGFCMGGTLAAMAAAYLTAKGQGSRVGSLTTIGAMFDFAHLGEWGTFTEPTQMEAMKRHLAHRGHMSAFDLQALFSVVRANDLIWSSVVNHYLLDQEAPASDILYWFADGAHIPAAFLIDYCEQLLRDNLLSKHGEMRIAGEPIDLAKLKTPLFAISLKDDHVSAWEATYRNVQLVGGEATFLLGGSGHNAGVINPPSANKHGYWSSDDLPETSEAWLETAERKEGSWWPEWQSWLAARSNGKTVDAREPGAGKLKVIEPAPGRYVRRRG